MTNVIKTGILGLDLVLGGGIHTRHICEISGKESSGKTTIAYTALGQAQRQGLLSAIIVPKGGVYHKQYASACGIHQPSIVVAQIDTVPESIDCAIELIQHGVTCVVIEDIVRGINSVNETPANQTSARFTREQGNALAKTVLKHDATAIITIDTTFKQMYSHPFWIQQHLHTTVEKDNVIVHVRRNPYGLTDVSVAVPFIRDRGIDYTRHILQLGIKSQLIKDNHAWYVYNEIPLGHGQAQATKTLMEQKDLAEQLTKAIRNTLWENLFV